MYKRQGLLLLGIAAGIIPGRAILIVFTGGVLGRIVPGGIVLRGIPRFLEQLKGMVAERVSLEWGRLYQFGNPREQAFCLSFLVGGVVGLIQSWLEGGRKETPEELAALSEAMILRGIEGLNLPR